MIEEEDLLPEEQIEETQEEPEFSFATVGEVSPSGITLILDGAEESGGKSYPCNAGQIFRAGDRVKIHKDSGTYVVEYVLGAPGSRFPLPNGGAKGKALLKTSAADYDVEWGDVPGTLPSGGAKGKFLSKKTATNYDVEWADPLPTGGAKGKALLKKSATDYDVEWGDVPGTLPSGGTAGKFLRKKSATNYDAEWADPSTTRLAYSSTVGVEINASGQIQPISTTQPSLGSSTYGKQIKDLYTKNGIVSLDATKLGFFSATPIAKKSLSSSATLAQLIQALKDYGLFS